MSTPAEVDAEGAMDLLRLLPECDEARDERSHDDCTESATRIHLGRLYCDAHAPPDAVDLPRAAWVRRLMKERGGR